MKEGSRGSSSFAKKCWNQNGIIMQISTNHIAMIKGRKIKVIFFTKAPIEKERVEVLQELARSEEIDIRAVIIEEAVHLPILKFIFVTIRRIIKGGIRIYDILRWSIKYFFQIFFSYKKTRQDPLKSFLDKKSIPLFIVKNTESKEALDLVEFFEPDIGIIYVHRILREKLFSIPKMFTINVHTGILPRYAGGDPCFWSLVDGSEEVGLTVHKVTKIPDKGDAILIKTIPIGSERSVRVLRKRVTALAPSAMLEAVLKIKNTSNLFIPLNMRKRLYRHTPSFFNKIKYKILKGISL